MTEKEKIIEKLRDDNEYYHGIGKSFMSNSDIQSLLENPNDYGKEREDCLNFAFGRHFHQSILEPNKASQTVFLDVSTRTTTGYKKYLEESGKSFVLLKKEGDLIAELVKVIKSNIHFYDEIFAVGNKFEEPEIGEIKGIMFKGKADIVTENYLIDLKTTSDINGFKWSAKKYNYDSQCYIYQMLFGKPMLFFVIDKETKQLGIFRPTESFLKSGELKVERAIAVHNKFFGENPTEDIANYYIDMELE